MSRRNFYMILHDNFHFMCIDLKKLVHSKEGRSVKTFLISWVIFFNFFLMSYETRCHLWAIYFVWRIKIVFLIFSLYHKTFMKNTTKISEKNFFGNQIFHKEELIKFKMCLIPHITKVSETYCQANWKITS